VRESSIFNKILIVCVGNICRSPTAERIFRDKLPGRTISSAGLRALVEKPIDSGAATLLVEHGYNADAHKARQLTGNILADADLILVMEASHKSMLMSKYPLLSGKVMMLGYWSDIEIEDPYQKSDEAYRHIFHQIERCCQSWSLKLD